MCGRDFYPRFGLKHKDDDFPLALSKNIKPGQIIPTIINVDNRNQFIGMKWGFVPVWTKDPQIGYKMINSRPETIIEKPSFRSAIRKTKCLIPATRFYGWDNIFNYLY